MVGKQKVGGEKAREALWFVSSGCFGALGVSFLTSVPLILLGCLGVSS